MKYIISFCIIGTLLFAYRSDDHKHIWVETQMDTVVIGAPLFSTKLEGRNWPTGKHEGAEIVCVKCFAKKRITIDYGSNGVGDYIQLPAKFDTSIFLNGESTMRSSGSIFINMRDTAKHRNP